ncbi:type VI secretion system ATPase TssH [Paracidovorax citrulli]|uniref:ATPase AAA-2 domain protein n=2 Tax=Paracidovorax citrulli TaxID=80869 RepID=A1TM85_PARC0|nr:type VI secretion system ATPase TssH [Paracidovorax citrulli]ABM32073.1 ATPase AAA-2 domain protein [Paracidovorax citrulli AAC00-1]ATG94899.1 type VI secretion system ATPase TssH [Paracidovorax citrulli]PVY66263.1 type VI secretion system protein VasG [Paracidovorax citrulli]QCX12001.1 Chaperone protein ClpB [Paracidovorax citrulli]REG69565.1 type VI secretion system protein VasG [Paracidovorax citrulli]
MSEISRQALFGKLNPLLFKSLESATVFCKLRGNPYVELVHWLHQLLQETDSDLIRLLRHFAVDSDRLATDVLQSLDRLPRGATSISDFSAQIESSIERGWVYATLMYGESQIRSAYWLSGMLRTRVLANELRAISGEFNKLGEPALSEVFGRVLPDSPESRLKAADGSGLGGVPGEASGATAEAAGPGEALKRYTVDLTERARLQELDPVTGRDEEVRQMVDILMRRRQNNPILVGEAGVGKTAVVEGLALRIAAGDVPPPLKDVQLRVVDIGLLQAGASMKGEFENRLRSLLDEVQASTVPIVLFIDEVHTLVGAGGQAGTGDAANLLKPALARGVLRTIGATTWAEYKKYIEKDPALTRRFQLVQIHEPDEAKAVHMLRGVAAKLEGHHKVRIGEDAVAAAVTLSHRYIPSRQLPDKAVSLLDTACSRVALGLHATPARLESVVRQLEALEVEKDIVQRELGLGVGDAGRFADIGTAIERLLAEKAELQERFEREKVLVQQIVDAEAALLKPAGKPGAAGAAQAPAPATAPAHASEASGEAGSGGAAAAGTAQGAAVSPGVATPEALAALRQDLARLQGEDPLLQPVVDASVVAAVVAEWTGIPVGRMVRDEVQSVLTLADTLEKRVIGQRHGLEAITRRIQTARAQLDNPGKPIGVFLLAGPSGVGKTETALSLAEALYGGEQNLITINMSEYQEAHTVSTLKGAPPGYVGYGEGGVLTEAVRRRPYSVVLLDEIEKAHPDVHELFFQVFDKGWMEDGEGRYIDFKNTVIILTSNVGSELIAGMCRDPELAPQPEALAQAVRKPLLEKFPAALLGRLVVVPYYPISDAMLEQIIRLQLQRIQTRIAERHGAVLDIDDAAVQLIRQRCTEVESGARMVDGIITQNLLPRLAMRFLQSSVDSKSIRRIRLGVADSDFAIEYEEA